MIAHKNATARLKVLNDPHTVMPDESVGNKKVIKLGGTTLELHYLGLNHSDSTLVMRLPKEKIIFIVDTIPVGAFPGRGFIDIYPLETEDFIKKVIAMDWERMIPGHPGPERPARHQEGRAGRPDADAGGLGRRSRKRPRTASAGTPSRRNSRWRSTPPCPAMPPAWHGRAPLLRTVGPRRLTQPPLTNADKTGPLARAARIVSMRGALARCAAPQPLM